MEPILLDAAIDADDPPGLFRPVVYWYTSFRCNLACKHCWVSSSPDYDTSADLNTEDLLYAASRLKTIRPRTIVLSGGEVLLRKDSSELIRRLIDDRHNMAIETNGMLLRPEHIELFQEGRKRGCDIWLALSLDGGNQQSHELMRGPGSFKPTLRGLRRLRDTGIPYAIQCVVTKANLRSIGELFDLARELEFDKHQNTLSFVIVNPVGRASEYTDVLSLTWPDYVDAYRRIAEGVHDYDGQVVVKAPPAAIPSPYLQQFIKRGNVRFMTSCSFPLIGILPDGTLTVCAMTDACEELSFGNVMSADLESVVATRILPLRADYDNATLTGVCADCRFKASCKGSCRAYAYSTTGSFVGPHPLCASLDEQGLFPEVYRESRRLKIVAAK